jgi:hypothetical protein
MDIEQVKKTVRQYLALKKELDVLSSRQDELKSRLMIVLDEVEPNSNGHRVLDINDDIVGAVKITKQKKVSNPLNMPVAEEILTVKGIKDLCIKMVPVLEPSAIMSAYYEGHLTEEDIDKMFPKKESYAFILKND